MRGAAGRRVGEVVGGRPTPGAAPVPRIAERLPEVLPPGAVRPERMSGTRKNVAVQLRRRRAGAPRTSRCRRSRRRRSGPRPEAEAAARPRGVQRLGRAGRRWPTARSSRELLLEAAPSRLPLRRPGKHGVGSMLCQPRTSSRRLMAARWVEAPGTRRRGGFPDVERQHGPQADIPGSARARPRHAGEDGLGDVAQARAQVRGQAVGDKAHAGVDLGQQARRVERAGDDEGSRPRARRWRSGPCRSRRRAAGRTRRRPPRWPRGPCAP